MVNIAIIGFGTVGAGAVKILSHNLARIQERVGAKVVIKKICDQDITTPRGVKVNPALFTTRISDVLNDPSIDMVVELIGGDVQAKKIIMGAIAKGKHVVTANKAVLAKNWGAIFSAARKKKVHVYFEASVGGGIPVLQALNEGLAANRIESIFGILNGTTNYILTRMTKAGKTFSQALKEAQREGFAEKDPTLDIEGIDTSQKLSILASIAFDSWLKPSSVYCEGITNIDHEDIKYGKEEFSYVLKLLGIIKMIKGKVEARVHPTFVSQDHLLTSVDNEFNAVYIRGDAVGQTMYYGKGAGQMAAASAVVSDIIYLARHIANKTAGKVPYVHYNSKKHIAVSNINSIQTKYYLRFTTLDKPGVLSRISGILGKHGVSIASCYQKERAVSREVPIIMVTHKAKEGDVRKALKQIDHLPAIKAKSKLIRIEEEY
ncbi:MAG: homoserine dehydrogenase [bacterium]